MGLSLINVSLYFCLNVNSDAYGRLSLRSSFLSLFFFGKIIDLQSNSFMFVDILNYDFTVYLWTIAPIFQLISMLKL